MKTKKNIKTLIWNFELAIKDKIKSKDNWLKIGKLIVYFFEICITGILIHYSITHFNWFSIGLLSAFAMYYIEWLIKLIKRKEMEE